MIISSVTTQDELIEILQLQANNLKKNLSSRQMKTNGFVSVEHTLDLLNKMNVPYPHTIAKMDDKVVAYVLSMTKDKKEDIPMLTEMIDMIDTTEYRGSLLKDQKYIIVGQVCVAERQRGNGLFSAIYKYHKTQLKNHFDYLVTGVSTSNLRSMKAHEKVGFQVLNIFNDADGEWANIICKL